MPFEKPTIVLEELTTGRDTKVNWKLIEDVIYRADGQRIVVPKGFVTDLTSTPKFLWSLIPPFGKYSKAAVVHDWLYRQQTTTRRQADKIFNSAMKELGVQPFKRHLMYLGVRIGGHFAWHSHKKG